MYMYENSSDFRFYVRPLVNAGGDLGDVVRIRRIAQDEFECVLARKGTPEYDEWIESCTQRVRNSTRRFGYAWHDRFCPGAPESKNDILSDRVLQVNQVFRRNRYVDTLHELHTGVHGNVLYKVSRGNSFIISIDTYAVVSNHDHRFTTGPQDMMTMAHDRCHILEKAQQQCGHILAAKTDIGALQPVMKISKIGSDAIGESVCLMVYGLFQLPPLLHQDFSATHQLVLNRSARRRVHPEQDEQREPIGVDVGQRCGIRGGW